VFRYPAFDEKLHSSGCRMTPNTMQSKRRLYSEAVYNDSQANSNSSWLSLHSRWGSYLLLFLLIVTGFSIFKNFLLLRETYLFKDIGSDTVNQYYPFILHVSEYLHSNSIPEWSFNSGLGNNIFPPIIYRDPFAVFLYLLDKTQIAYAIIYVEFLKILFGGIVFYFYLLELDVTVFSAVIGAISFTFSGVMIVGSGWYAFTFESLNIAFLLLAFEKLFKNNLWQIFPLSIALIGISMPFYYYIYGVFLLLYSIFRYSSEHKWNWKEYFGLLSKMFVWGLLGVALSSAFMFSSVLQLLDSPRVAGDSSYFSRLFSVPMFALADRMQYVTSVMRFFSSDLMGTGSQFRGWHNYLEAPMFYIGLPSLLLFTQVFSFLGRKQKITYLIFLCFWIFPVIFPFFRYAFWLFTGDYYRIFSLFVSFVFLFFSIQALNCVDRTGKINLPVLLFTLIALLGILYFPYFDARHNPIDPQLQAMVRTLLLFYTLLLIVIRIPNLRRFVQVVFLLTLCFEAQYFSNITVNDRSVITSQELHQKVGYNDYTNEAVQYIKSTDSSFYRIDKTYSSGPAIPSLNDSQVQNYKGTSSYNSFNQFYYIKFLEATNVIHGDNEAETRWAVGLVGKPLLESFASVKYVLTKIPQGDPSPALFEFIKQIADVRIFRNKFYLPLGFTYHHYITESQFHRLNTLQKEACLLKAFVVPDAFKGGDGFTQLTAVDIPADYTVQALSGDISQLRQETMTLLTQKQNYIKGAINIDKRRMLFFSIPYDRGWKAFVNGKETKPMLINIGFMGLLLDKGKYTVELKYTPPLFWSGLIVSAIAIAFYGFLLIRVKFLSAIFPDSRRFCDSNQSVGCSNKDNRRHITENTGFIIVPNKKQDKQR
jgi:uncharacterized membrane protein YfhO